MNLDALLELIAGRRIVLLGEASHGTHEFYAERARITRRLIEDRGVDAVAVEADWPDAYRVNRFVRGEGEDETAEQALGDFRRFPTWMWRNTVVRDFVAWLREHNARAPAPTGFYGIDLYSLRASMEAVLRYLDEVDPEAATRARDRYACLDHAGAHSPFLADPCEDAVVEQLVDHQRRAPDDDQFFAEQNARLVRNAERYQRAVYRGREESWNLRDTHMVETIHALGERIAADRGHPARIVVWAHNSHLGDARATEMGEQGELNVGQLVRERWGRDAALVGFSTDRGTVTAADDWGGPPRRMAVRPGLRGSYERVFADEWPAEFVLDTAMTPVPPRLLQRAIGVIYRPATERMSHYFRTRLADQFDALIHIGETTAVEPLDPY